MAEKIIQGETEPLNTIYDRSSTISGNIPSGDFPEIIIPFSLKEIHILCSFHIYAYVFLL